MYDKDFSSRLDFAVQKMGGITKASSLIGTSLPTITRWKEGISDPKMSNVIAFAKAADISLDWLMTGKGSPEGADNYTHQPAANDSDYKDVPIYDLAASAGTGRLVADEHITNYLKFPNWWFVQRNLNHADIAALYTKGDSMEPTIPDNALLLIDQSKTYLSDGKVYVVRVDDELYVKRIKRILGGGLELISDNVHYATKALDKELLHTENFFQVIGQVVHIGIDLPH